MLSVWPELGTPSGTAGASGCFFSPSLTDSYVNRQHRLGHGQRPDVQAVQGLHPIHRQQEILHGCEVHTFGSPWEERAQW